MRSLHGHLHFNLPRQCTLPLCISRSYVHGCRPLYTAPTTAIHPPSEASSRFNSAKEQLRASLTELSCLNYASKSRVKLALRCLEQDSAPFRIAILAPPGVTNEDGHHPMDAPSRFLRVLLADPLNPAQLWEKQLLNWSHSVPVQGLLLRYSPTTESLTTPPSSPVAYMSIHSPFLHTHNLEILLTSLPAVQSSKEDIDAPALHAPILPSDFDAEKNTYQLTGTVIRYPVHKSIIFSKGLAQSLTTTGLISRICESDGGMDNVCTVAWLPEIERKAVQPSLRGKLQLLDLIAAEVALDHFRNASPKLSALPEAYSDSGLGELRNWAAYGTDTQAYTVPRATRSLISSIFRDVSTSMCQPSKLSPSLASQLPTGTNGYSIRDAIIHPGNVDTLKNLTDAMRSFTTASHQELKTSLDSAFHSWIWTRKLSWYRLAFNVDDVSYLVSTNLSDKLLPATEREGLMLAGRMWAAGFRSVGEAPVLSDKATEGIAHPTPAESEIIEIVSSAQNDGRASSSPREALRPISSPSYPPFFQDFRTQVAATLIPSLHSAAIKYVLASTSLLCTSVLTTALLHFSQIPLYTSFTAATVGGVISMGYLQRKWDQEKAKFEKDVRELGRQAVAQAEKWGWGLLRKVLEEASKTEDHRGFLQGIAWDNTHLRRTITRANQAVEQGQAGLKQLGEN